MGLRSTAAVVVHSLRMTGSSKLVTLISERYGLLKVMAKGARRPKSRYGAALEPLTLVDITYYHKDTRDIQSLSDVEIRESYDMLKTDIGLFSVASCMLETTRFGTAGGDPSAGTYPLLIESLASLEKAPAKDNRKHLWRFMLRFLDIAGYRPDFEQCIECGKKPKGRSVFFSYADGGILCSCSDPGSRFGSNVSPGVLMVMRDLISADDDSLRSLKIGKAQGLELEDIVLKFLAYHTGRSRIPKSLAFLRKIENI